MDAEGVPGEDGPRGGVRERHLVRGVARREVDQELAAPEIDPVAVGERAQPVARHRIDGAEEGSHLRLAVQAGRARDELRRLGEVRRAALVHVHVREGEAFAQAADPAGMVEVDVRDDDVGQIVRPDAESFEPGDDRFDRRSWSGLDERRSGRVEQVRGRVPLASPVERVDGGDARLHLERHGLHVRECIGAPDGTAAVRACRCAVLASRAGRGGGIMHHPSSFRARGCRAVRSAW
jgi:hypothetical protein